TGGTWRRRTFWKRVRQKLLYSARTFDSQIGSHHLQSEGQIALHRKLPVLRVASAKSRIDPKSGVQDVWRAPESIRERQRIRCAVLHAQTRGKRRLLGHLGSERLIKRLVVVNPVTAPHN